MTTMGIIRAKVEYGQLSLRAALSWKRQLKEIQALSEVRR